MFHLIYFLIVGIVAGWAGGKIMKGRGFGLLGNLVVGILGSIVGAVIFDAIGLRAYGLIAQLLCAITGAVVLLYGAKVINSRTY